METTIQRAAVGRVASIGDVYDAHTDCFTGFSILKKELPASAVSVPGNPGTKTAFLTSASLDDKFSKLDINPELGLSFLSGLVNFSGSGSFLKDDRKSNRLARASLLYSIKTKNQRLNVTHEEAVTCYDMDGLQKTKGTHVVVSIEYGANTIVSAEQTASSESKIRETKGQLEAAIKWIDSRISADPSTGGHSEEHNNTSFSIKVHGDVLSDSSADLPINVEQAIDFMKRMPQMVAKSNNGWGKPLAYVLVPINEIRERLNLPIRADLILKEISLQSIVRCTRLMEDFASVKRKLNGTQIGMDAHADSVPEGVRTEVRKANDSFAVLEARTRSSFARILKEVRSGEADAEEMEAEIASAAIKLSERKSVLQPFEKHNKKLEFVDTLKQMPNVILVKDHNSMSSLLPSVSNEKSYVFYLTQMEDEDEVWCKNRDLFFELQSREPQTKILVVPANGSFCRIALLKNGKEAISDISVLRTEVEGLCIAKCVSGFERMQPKPHKRTPISGPCPGEDCPTLEREWNCEKCKSVLEYGFDGFIYCNCGKRPELEFVFRCNSKIHGPEFASFPQNSLLDLLSRHRLTKELNILIIGETGVGKSTFLNAFANYMTYETMADAEEGGLVTVIPNSFTFRYQEIKTGEPTTNEIMETGKSSTQSSRVYRCRLPDDRILRIIDTPGVGDVEGMQKDKKNFENIMDTISNLDELHAIVILMKPNEARLNILFRFCISELLLHLHQSAAKNVIFGFTHTRGTFFEPGATETLLRDYLNKNTKGDIVLSNHTMYCFDSESLAIISQGIKMSADMKSDYKKSWDRSVEETKRLLDHVKSLPPHKVHDTQSLNEARTLILRLNSPLAEITRFIQQNVERNQKLVSQLTTPETWSEFFARLGKSASRWLARIVLASNGLSLMLVAQQLDGRQTVCTDQSCVTYETYDDIRRVRYSTTCHQQCTEVEGDHIYSMNDGRLSKCDAMRDGNCLTCGHHFTKHMHLGYIYQLKEMAGNLQLTKETKKEKVIANLIDRIKEYKGDEKKVEKTAAIFAAFLKKNAIIVVSDARVQYLEHMIREEEAKPDKTESEKQVIKGLEAAKRAHIQEMKAIEESMKKADGQQQIEATAVREQIEKLYSMKHFGSMIKDAATVGANAARLQYQEIPIHVPKTKKKSTNTGRSYFSIPWIN